MVRENEEYDMVWDDEEGKYVKKYFADGDMTVSKEEQRRKNFIKNLQSKKWRIKSGKLYKILDKDGKIVPFIPNDEQCDFLFNKHSRNVIVKARQIGFTTAICIDYLDDVLFNKNMHAAIIAQDGDTATEIFDKKIKLAWEHFPPFLKSEKMFAVKRERANMFYFENTGSSIRTAVKLRGTTVRRLHVSEFGYTSVHDRLKADEIFNGAIEAVPKDGIVTIESTAEGAEGLFFDIASKAKELKEQGYIPNEMQWKLFFYPRWEHPAYMIESNIGLTNEEQDYFVMLADKFRIKLSSAQKKWYALKWRDKKDNIYKEYPSYFDEAFNMTIKGAYYAKDLETARTGHRVGLFPHNPQLETITSWDLGGSGGSDSTAVWFYQKWMDKTYVIDYVEFDGMSWLEQLSFVKNRGYNVTKWIGPHDIHQNTIGESKYTLAKGQGIDFIVLKRSNNLTNDIQLVRTIFPRLYFNEGPCAKGLERLGMYRRQFSEKQGMLLDTPAHNGASHCADSLRYFACWDLGEQRKETNKSEGFIVHGGLNTIENDIPDDYLMENNIFTQ